MYLKIVTHKVFDKSTGLHVHKGCNQISEKVFFVHTIQVYTKDIHNYISIYMYKRITDVISSFRLTGKF